jgi:hypothetical protein
MAKSKAALTSARTAANAIYCPPLLQALIDTQVCMCQKRPTNTDIPGTLQSGTLHAEEKDYKTAYSYFFEAMEAFAAQDSPHALTSLKHMLLCKIMTNASDEAKHPHEMSHWERMCLVNVYNNRALNFRNWLIHKHIFPISLMIYKVIFLCMFMCLFVYVCVCVYVCVSPGARPDWQQGL